jgi:putative transposase
MADPRNLDFSTRWKKIKREFILRWFESGGTHPEVSTSRRSKGERRVWQRRFWEHLVRDEADLERCCDYVHYNSVKHGYVATPGQWRWSTYARFVDDGHYPPDWGEALPASLTNDSPMGE